MRYDGVCNTTGRQRPLEMTEEKEHWLYEGTPEMAGLVAGELPTTVGGYVLGMVLQDGSIWLGATRFPEKYLTNWRYNSKRYGLPEITKVLITVPYIRYEAVKRLLMRKMENYRSPDRKTYAMTEEEFKREVDEVLGVVKK